jgi:hypothetical protein
MIILGMVMEIYTFQIVRLFGHMSWAEEKLGQGGSFTAWRLFGLAAILIGFGMIRYRWLLS